MTEDPQLAARLQRAMEPYQSMVYMVPEAAAEYAAIGLDAGRMGYFASRSAPMGAASAATVTAAFYSFSPALVASVIPRAWTLASVEDIIAARWRVADRALRRLLGDRVGSPEVARAAALIERAAGGLSVSGRPLFAGHTELPWPDEPHLRLWLGTSLLREYRGDGHITALTAAELSGTEAHLSFIATGRSFTPAAGQASRGWTDEQWAAAADRLRARGLLADGPELVLTTAGQRLRDEVEAMTNRLAMAPWRQLGEAGTEELRRIVTDLSWQVVDGGAIDQRAFLLPRTPQDPAERAA
jgi:helix-turn-helix protein